MNFISARLLPNACLYNLFSVGTPIILVRVGCLALAVYKIIILCNSVAQLFDKRERRYN